MTDPNVTHTFVAGTDILASEANQNFDDLLTFLSVTGVNAYQNLSIEAAALASGAVTATKIATGAVETAKLASLAVTAAKLAADSVTTDKILNGAVTEEKLSAALIGSTGIVADQGIVASKIHRADWGIYNVLAFGATGDGVTDDTEAVQDAFAAANSAGGTVFFPPGTYVITDTLEWHASDFSVKGHSAKLDFTTTAVSPAFNVTGSGDTGSGGADFFEDFKHTFEGFDIYGADTDLTTIDCFYLADTTHGVVGCELRSLHIEGFRDQVTTGNYNWAIRFHGIMFRNFHRYGAALTPGGTAGELYQFYGCTWGNGRNALTGTATAIYTDGTGFLDAAFYGCSFDYQDIELDQRCGRLLFSGCHWENNSSEPMFKVTSVSGQRSPVLNIIGGTINPEEVSDRDYLFAYTRSTGVSIDVLRTGVFFGTYDRTTQIDYWTDEDPADTPPKVRQIGGSYHVHNGNLAPIIGNLDNRLYNAGFEEGDTSGWTTVVGGSNTWDAQTSEKVSGTYGGRVASVAGAGFSRLYQQVPVRPGEVAHFSGQVKPDITAGTFVVRLKFLAQDGTTEIVAYDQDTFTSADPTEWTKSAAAYNAPIGAAYARMEFTVDSHNGTVYFDDFVMTTV